MKTLKTLLLLGIVSFTFYSFTTVLQDKWVVPKEYVNMKNPTDPNVDKAIGKSAGGNTSKIHMVMAQKQKM